MAKYGNDGPSNSGGSGCYSVPQKGIPGPKSPGPPPSMRKALAKKQIRDKGRSSPGTR
jgi:hypothetical protein